MLPILGLRAFMKKSNPSNKARAFVDEDALDKIIDAVTQSALAGDKGDQKLILELFGKRKGRPVKIDVGLIQTPYDCDHLATATASLMTEGKITPDECDTILDVIANRLRIYEGVVNENRMRKIESVIGVNQSPLHDYVIEPKKVEETRLMIIDEKLKRAGKYSKSKGDVEKLRGKRKKD